MKGQVEKARRSLQLLESFRVPISIEDMALSLSTLEYPSKVEASGKEVEIALDADKVRMMDKLALEKEAFDKEVESLGEQTRAAKILDDYANKEKVVEIVNGLMDKVQAYSLTHWLTYLLTYSLAHSLLLTHSLTPFLIRSPMPKSVVITSTCVRKSLVLLQLITIFSTSSQKNYNHFSSCGTWHMTSLTLKVSG